MNIETEIVPELWKSIQTQYENRNYTGAILNSVYYISNLIRERTGLESDGVSLVGEAFGGKSPKLKVNQLQTESEMNIQRGFEQILRGVYQAIRNPRSHENYTDSKEDAEAIIVFLNYMIKVIIQSKSPFSKDEFLKSIFDPGFVQDDDYAELLVNKIPARKRLEIFIEVFRKKENGDAESLKFFISALMKIMETNELQQAYKVVSEELIESNDISTLRLILIIMPSDSWPYFDLIGRHRIENRLIKSIEEGKYNQVTKRCDSGGFGTWITNIKSENFIRKEDLIITICNKLWSDDNGQKDYVFKFLFSYLQTIADPPSDYVVGAIKAGLKDGDERFYDGLNPLKSRRQSWQEAFKIEYTNFKTKEGSKEEDIPF